MKRLLVFHMMLVYILAVSGVMIHVHFCSKTIESWSFNTTPTGCDDNACNDEEQSDDCCKDKVIAQKVAHDQHLVEAIKITTAPTDVHSLPAFPLTGETDLIAVANRLITHCPNAPPGRWQNIPLYKLHTRFTLYG